MEWQTIESAPKDGTPIDIWCGKWNERHPNMRRVELSPENVFYDPIESGTCCVRTATHWMPLPNPPKQDEVAK